MLQSALARSSDRLDETVVRQADGLVVRRLEGRDGTAFAGLTYPRLAGIAAMPAAPWTAIGAWRDGRPVGLALAYAGDAQTGMLVSLFVEKTERRRGIATALAAAAARHLAADGLTRMRLGFVSDSPARPALERLVAGLGGPVPTPVAARVTGLAGAMAKAGGRWPGVGRLLQERQVRFSGWDGLSEDDLGAIDAIGRRLALDAPARDLLAVEGLCPEVSLIVRREGVPVGWVVGAHRPSPLKDRPDAPTIFYTTSRAEPELERSGVMLAAFWHAFSRQAARFGPEAIASYYTEVPAFIAFSRRRFAPLALCTETVLESAIPLG